MFNENRKDELVGFCREMIRTPSLSGQEEKVAQLIAQKMENFGYDKVEFDEYGNVAGRIFLGEGGKTILLEGHMDHVEVSDPSKWTMDPFGAEIKNERIYGRATTDMKGNLSAMIYAGALVKQDLGKIINGEVVVAGSVHEECFEGIASESIGKRYEPDYVVIGEPSNLTLKRGQRGRAEVVLETFGKTAHSSDPSVGLNAIRKMVKALSSIDRDFVPQVHPVLGKGILEVTDIISSPYPGASVIPDLCRVTFDRRLLVGDDPEKVLGQVEEILKRSSLEDNDLKTRVTLAVGKDKCYTGKEIEATRFAPAWLFDEDEPFVQRSLKGLRSMGIDPEISHYYFCTNGSYYAGKAGIPTIGFGGSLETLAHVVDEYIEISQLVKACKGYWGIIKANLS